MGQMDMVFTIAGHALTAERLTMRGNTIEVDFAPEAAGPLAEAYGGSQSVCVANFPVTYSVQDYRTEGAKGCRAILLVNSSAGRVLH
jgi:hypothetical protein